MKMEETTCYKMELKQAIRMARKYARRKEVLHTFLATLAKYRSTIYAEKIGRKANEILHLHVYEWEELK